MNLIDNILKDIKVELNQKFHNNFAEGGFFGEKWRPVKVHVKGKKGKSGRAIIRPSHLIKTGKLRRSIRASVAGNSVTFTSSVPYAAVHNYGLHTGRGKGFNMPRRQFIGKYPSMRADIERIVQDNINELTEQLNKSIKP